MKAFAIMLNASGRPAVVVGGGPVGLRKVRALLKAGAAVRLVVPRVGEHDDLKAVELVQAEYRPELLQGAKLVFACTDDAALNAKIAADARAAGALVNAADQPEDCDFFLPAVAEDGPVVVAVGTGGACPALAAELRDRLAQALPPRAGEFAQLLGRIRDDLKSQISNQRRRMQLMKRLAKADVVDAFATRGEAAVREIMEQWLKSNAT